MYSYLHRYHAGNFADVHKHLVLMATLNKLIQKPSPFCVLDAFAGEGQYHLDSEESKKNAEFENGISRLLKVKPASDIVAQYIALIQSYNTGTQIQTYPGSPEIISKYLRTNDKGIFIEGHPSCYPILKHHFKGQPNAHVHKRDAYEALSALIPFKEKRGLVFLDPSYEVKSEYEKIADQLIHLHAKFSNGIYLLWYPILVDGHHKRLKEMLCSQSTLKLFEHEFYPKNINQAHRLRGSGMILINPPWQVDEIIQSAFAELEPLFL
jgi:23S rRNA (adenine2030-N6)-methyltransferase